MKLCRLNEQGMDQFINFLDSLNSDTPLPYPSALLQDPTANEVIKPEIEIERRSFGSRYAAAEYLYHKFEDSGLTNVEKDHGLWAWLSLFYFEELCPPENGRYVLKEKARYFPDLSNFRRYYRHPLAGSFLIYSAHRDNPSRTLGLLSVPLDKMNDIIEQLASRQEIITNAGLVELVTELYYDKTASKPKKGSGGKGDGCPRRLADILNQFDTTYDLYSINLNDMLSLLPREFNRFREEVTK
jgi:hypothetical protein